MIPYSLLSDFFFPPSGFFIFQPLIYIIAKQTHMFVLLLPYFVLTFAFVKPDTSYTFTRILSEADCIFPPTEHFSDRFLFIDRADYILFLL